MHDATSPGLSQFVLQPKHVGHAKQEAFQTGVKKTCVQFLLVLWSPLLSLCLSLRRVQGELGGCDWMVAQSAHRGNKTRQTELRTRTLLFLRTLLLTDIHITGAQQAPLKCRAYVMANPNWLRSPDSVHVSLCAERVCVTQIFHYHLDNSNYSPHVQRAGHRGSAKPTRAI